MMPCEQQIHAKVDSLVQEDQECHHWKPDQEVIVHAPGSDTEVGGRVVLQIGHGTLHV